MLYPYRYNRQFEKYLSQFKRVLSGFQVRDGVERNGEVATRRVKVVYGSMSRVVASVLNKREGFTNQTLPIIGMHLSGIEKDTQNKKNFHHVDHVAYQNADGDRKSYARLMGPAFNLNVSVDIYASSHEEIFSILEQILLIFNPRVAIQVDNSVFNSDYLTEIILESISNDVNYPTGTDSQIVSQNLTFRLPVRLAYPIDLDAPTIQEITARIISESEEGLGEVLYEEVITGE